MRVGLDYYRILGLPLAASDEQLRQAYGDRIVQLPRNEYSQAAIDSRKQIIEEAYVVLSNPQERKVYDKLYLSRAYYPLNSSDGSIAAQGNVDNSRHQSHERHGLSIDVPEEGLVGALLILQELGEYEQVLKLGQPYLSSRLTGNNYAKEAAWEYCERLDVLLTVALACLELGREQWQQSNYENAAVSLETGLEMLTQEDALPNVQGEIQADLYKLQPYRILELLALPIQDNAQRQQGIRLLEEVLEKRGGIDGNGNDRSGLSVDDFLRFIQQIRHYLTVAEQHKLFERESKRPSAVAIYLAVYSLIARGFTQRQPALIRQAKKMLTYLGKRQDVHLEQSLCALLLGQTEEATCALELSGEYEALAFIREKSQGSPDLLPGLCLYGERWLQSEVFPHFRDLTKHSASLKDYFADEQVQAYLEALPPDRENNSNGIQAVNDNFDGRRIENNLNQDSSNNHKFTSRDTHTNPGAIASVNDRHENFSSSTSEPNSRFRPASYEETVNQGLESHSNKKSVEKRSNDLPIPQRVPRSSRTQPPSTSSGRSLDNRQHTFERQQRYSRSPFQLSKRMRFLILALLGLLLFWLLGSVASGLLRNATSPVPELEGEQLAIGITQPPFHIPVRNEDDKPVVSEGNLTKETAQEIIEKWLEIKRTALGQTRDVDSLDKVLAKPALTRLQSLAKMDRSKSIYRVFQHDVKVDSIQVKELSKNSAHIIALVNEKTSFYRSNSKVPTRKPSDDLIKVKYDLVRSGDTWLIKAIKPI